MTPAEYSCGGGGLWTGTGQCHFSSWNSSIAWGQWSPSDVLQVINLLATPPKAICCSSKLC